MRRTLSIMLTFALLTALTLGACEDSGPTMIRIHNASTYDFAELQVGDEVYGDLAAGAYTEYRDFGTAYRYNYVRLTINGAELILQPVDYVGEEPLGSGYFTYEISVIDGASLAIEAQPSDP